ncbi:unnamed protein product, partial [Rotaria sp. Silwood2]
VITKERKWTYLNDTKISRRIVAAIECLDGVLIELDDKQNNSELRYAGVGEWVQVK